MYTHMFSYIGLLIIFIAWAYQLLATSHGSKKMERLFPGIYAVGVAFLVYDSFTTGDMYIALLNILTLVAAGGLFLMRIFK